MRWPIFIALAAALLPSRPLAAQTDLKANMLSAVVLVPHVGIETAITDRLTLQLDVMASFWRSVGGTPLELVMVIPEVRYHFDSRREGFYVGLHAGTAAYRLQKWNYIATDLYQEGTSVLLGFTVGYKARLSERLTLDFFVGGGNQQGNYRGYDASTDERYDGAVGLNGSGEWLPYRGGAMLSFRLREPRRDQPSAAASRNGGGVLR